MIERSGGGGAAGQELDVSAVQCPDQDDVEGDVSVGVVFAEGGIMGGGQQIRHRISAGIVLEAHVQVGLGAADIGRGLDDGDRDDVGILGQVLLRRTGDASDLEPLRSAVGVESDLHHVDEPADRHHDHHQDDPNKPPSHRLAGQCSPRSGD